MYEKGTGPGWIISKVRRDKGWSQEDLAKKTRLKIAHISSYERNTKVMTKREANRLGKVLKIRPELLIQKKELDGGRDMTKLLWELQDFLYGCSREDKDKILNYIDELKRRKIEEDELFP